MKQAILWVIVLAWIALWAVFHVESFIEEDLATHGKVKGFTLEEKHAYIIGEDLHDFMFFCKEKLPPQSRFDFKADLDGYRSSRFVYYLYPHCIVQHGADYILVYKDRSFHSGEFAIFAEFDEESRILRRKGVK